MFRSRAVKTLSLLVAAMTAGTIALMLMETPPIRPTRSHLAAATPPADSLGPVFDSRVPFQPLKWRNIVLHASTDPRGKILSGCHFVLDMREADADPKILSTPRWKDQTDGRHVFVRGVNWNDSSIGLCLVGDFSRRGPSPRQMKTLLALTRKIQRRFGIPRDNVYLAADIGQAETSPGPAFPREKLDAQLIRAVP